MAIHVSVLGLMGVRVKAREWLVGAGKVGLTVRVVNRLYNTEGVKRSRRAVRRAGSERG